MEFRVIEQSKRSRARRGILTTAHGSIETPHFFFCATKGAIKGLSPQTLRQAGVQALLANTYHLMILPGAQVIRQAGGLRSFMGWSGPLMTDSGGFQIFAMGYGTVADEIKRLKTASWQPSLIKITEQEAIFRSYFDGKTIRLSPETAIDIQWLLGSNFLMQLDECTPFHATQTYTAQAMERSLRWGERCVRRLSELETRSQGLYGIIQGGTYPDLRRYSAQAIAEQSFFGTAIGGSLGGSKPQMHEIIDATAPYLPERRPVHLLGIGDIDDIRLAIAAGVDTFDCVAPTRLGRHGWALLSRGLEHHKINLRNASYRTHHHPLDPECNCYTCVTFTCAYLHYLLKVKEMLGPTLITLHNIATMTRLMTEIRENISYL